ncbi:MAG: tetratricopeptide repeat protein [Ketobacteraceae bacterium]|nr:tetratricopeptide repeat protein [Ketobacteraceae bacterium]
MPRILALIAALLACQAGMAADTSKSQSPQKAPNTSSTKEPTQEQLTQTVDQLKEPLYSPFIERYVLDELKQLRSEMAAQRVEMTRQIVDREHSAIDRAVSYATNTVTYFFYLIAAASSILVLIGWTSIREMRERVMTLADEEISKLVRHYEERLQNIEKQLKRETEHIEQNREEIALNREIQALWLRAGQETSPTHKIEIYDDIIKRRSTDVEALTYKADAVLELQEPQWAANLCHQALGIDPENSHAFYQLGCAYASMDQFDEAVQYLKEAMARRESYREDMMNDQALKPLKDYKPFQDLVSRS